MSVQIRILLVAIYNGDLNMSKQRCFVLYERGGTKDSAFIEVDDAYITGSLFGSLKYHVSNLIANKYEDTHCYVLILDFKVIT